MAYRDERTAWQARVEALERELEELRGEAERHSKDNARLRGIVRRYRLGRGLVLSAVGGLAGLLVSTVIATAAGNLRILVPGALLGGLLGMLVGLAQDIDRRE